jgi:hypothetical protein
MNIARFTWTVESPLISSKPHPSRIGFRRKMTMTLFIGAVRENPGRFSRIIMMRTKKRKIIRYLHKKKLEPRKRKTLISYQKRLKRGRLTTVLLQSVPGTSSKQKRTCIYKWSIRSWEKRPKC